MRKLALLLLLLIMIGCDADAQQAVLTGNVRTLGGGFPAIGTTVIAEVRSMKTSNPADGSVVGCPAGFLRVRGTAVIADTVYKMTPNSTTGAVSKNIYRSDFLDCGGAFTTFYRFYITSSGRTISFGDTVVNSSIFYLNTSTFTALTTPTMPPVWDALYARLDGANVNWNLFAKVGTAVPGSCVEWGTGPVLNSATGPCGSGTGGGTILTALTATALGGVKGTGTAIACSGTDKLSGFNVDGSIKCDPDQTGTAGTGITSFNGSTQSTQSFAAVGTTGTAPAFTTNTGTGVHTLNIPLASAAGVTAGLLSKTDYDAFNAGRGFPIVAPAGTPGGATTTGIPSIAVGYPEMGFSATVPQKLTITQCSRTGTTATVTVSIASPLTWPINGHVLIENLPSPCNVLNGTQTITGVTTPSFTFTTATTGTIAATAPVAGTAGIYTVYLDAYMFMFNRLISSTTGAAQRGTWRFAAGDSVYSRDPASSTDVILIKKWQGSGDTRRAQLGDQYGAVSQGPIESQAPQGTAPFPSISTTENPNLNAGMLQGFRATDFILATTGIDWTDINNLPTTFTPTNHTHLATDLVATSRSGNSNQVQMAGDSSGFNPGDPACYDNGGNTTNKNCTNAGEGATWPGPTAKTFNSDVIINGILTTQGPWQEDSVVDSTSALTNAAAGHSKIGFDADGKAKVSENGGSKLKVIQDEYKSATFGLGNDDIASPALTNAQLGGQKSWHRIDMAGTVTEIFIRASNGTPSVTVARDRNGVVSNLTASQLGTGAAGAMGCANTAGSGLSSDGTTTCTLALTNTGLAVGDWLDISAGTANSARRVSVNVVWKVTPQ